MAAGFKTATVTSAKVPSTQTNFPSYVDLSRLGITTLAEAQSVRVYADSGKVTEWAREIVSATEMHVKVPSLTSTTPIYVDWDGVRADYTATDTYGRNAVWSDYAIVIHGGTTTNSVGSNDVGTNNGVTLNASGGKIGGDDEYSTNDYFQWTDAAWLKPTSVTVQGWFNITSISAGQYPRQLDRMNAFTQDGWRTVFYSDSGVVNYGGDVYNGAGRTARGATSLSTGIWYMGHMTYNNVNAIAYLNGTQDGISATTSGNITYRTTTDARTAKNSTGTSWSFNGLQDEIRMRPSAISASWVTTEYNNQSDEAGFWGTWTDAGGGGTPIFIPKVSFIG